MPQSLYIPRQARILLFMMQTPSECVSPSPSPPYPETPRKEQKTKTKSKSKGFFFSFQSLTKALLKPSSVMPTKAKAMLRFRLWLRLKLSTKSCRATLTMMPAVMANKQA